MGVCLPFSMRLIVARFTSASWARSVSDKARSPRSLLRLPFIRISQLGLIYFVLILLYNCERSVWKCQANNNLEVDTMEFTPTVNQAGEFLEISNDFTNSKEVVREAISNSLI